MAHFAKLDENNIVTYVTVGRDEDDEIELSERTGEIYKKTSYNTYGGKHLTGQTPFRKNFAAVGYYYDESRDAFIPPKQYDSWILNEDTCLWESPIPYPDPELIYFWNEETQEWVLTS